MPMTDFPDPHAVLLLTAATALLLATLHDVAVRTIPNRASLIVAAAGMGLNALDRQLMPALFGGGVVFAGAWQGWRRGWIGGGDVKLLTACALLVPPASVPELVLSTAIAGGILALSYRGLAPWLTSQPTRQPAGLPTRRPAGLPARIWQPAGLPARIWRIERRRIRRGLSLPYACAIAAGVLLTLNLTIPLG